MRFYRYRHRPGRGRGALLPGFIFRLVCVMAACTVCALLLDARLRPAVRTVAQTRADNLAAFTVNESVNSLLSREGVSYESLVDISADADGKITSIRTNASEINRLKASIALAVDNALSQNSDRKIKIPLGTASGIDLLAGMGPDISVNVQMTGSARADFQNSFLAAGINQTQHRIMLKVKTSVYIFLWGNESLSSFESEFCVAETVIVGDVPSVMVQTPGEEIPQK